MMSSSNRPSFMLSSWRAGLLCVLGTVLLFATLRLAVSAGVPALWSPYPMVQFLILSSGWPQWVCAASAFSVMCVVAVVISRPSRGRLYAGAIIGLLTLMTIGYFVVFIPTGLAHQGSVHVVFMIAVNVLSLGVLWWGWRVLSWPLPFRNILAMALFLSIWLFWFAFPYFGEGI